MNHYHAKQPAKNVKLKLQSLFYLIAFTFYQSLEDELTFEH